MAITTHAGMWSLYSVQQWIWSRIPYLSIDSFLLYDLVIQGIYRLSDGLASHLADSPNRNPTGIRELGTVHMQGDSKKKSLQKNEVVQDGCTYEYLFASIARMQYDAREDRSHIQGSDSSPVIDSLIGCIADNNSLSSENGRSSTYIVIAAFRVSRQPLP